MLQNLILAALMLAMADGPPPPGPESITLATDSIFSTPGWTYVDLDRNILVHAASRADRGPHGESFEGPDPPVEYPLAPADAATIRALADGVVAHGVATAVGCNAS